MAEYHEIIDKILEKWEAELRGMTVPGVDGSEWFFDGTCDLSGSWFWTNKKLGLTLAATPFWSGMLDSIPVQIYNTDDGDDEYLYVTGIPSSAKEYWELMRDYLKALERPASFKSKAENG